MVNETSIEAYYTLLADKVISKQEHTVIEALNAPMTSRELSKATGLERSSVCGRLNKLCEKSLVKEHSVVVCPTTGKSVHKYERV